MNDRMRKLRRLIVRLIRGELPARQIKELVLNRIMRNNKVCAVAITYRASKLLLKTGVYYRDEAQKKVLPLHRKNLSVRNLTHAFFVRGTGNNSMTSFDYNYGMRKGIAFSEQWAYALYPSPVVYRYAKERLEEYYHRFNYPKVGGIQCSDGAMCIRMDRIQGRRPKIKDSTDGIILRELFQYLLTAECRRNEDGSVWMLQHGDADDENTLLTADGVIVFIDLDDIGFWPPMYDILHYCYRTYELKELVQVFRDNEAEFSQICRRIGLGQESEPLDSVFYQYVKFMSSAFSQPWTDHYAFLLNPDVRAYPKTYELLQSLHLM